MTTLTDANGNAATMTYDTLGVRTGVTDALGHGTTYALDEWERATGVTTPAGTTTTAYDADGDVTGLTDPNGHTTTSAYDADGRPTSITKANGDQVTCAYDGTGQRGLLSSKTDGNGHTTTYSYTARNEKSGASYPDGTSEGWGYDAAGDLAGHTDADGHTVGYTYDEDDRRTGIAYPSGAGVTFGYDAAGRRTGMTDGTGTTAWSYDAANRPTGITSPQGTVSYAYDSAGRRTQVALSGTGSWGYAYDSGNRLTSTTTPYGEATGFSYDAADRLTRQAAANGAVTTFGYDGADRPTDVWHRTSGGGTLGRYQYSHDAAGNVTERDDSDGSVTTFGYDAADQLTGESRSGGYSVGYTYDHNGNRLTKTLNGATDAYTYDGHDKLLTAGGKSYTYDNDGNTLTVTSGGVTTTLAYDYENRVTGISGGGVGDGFAYNGLGLRVGKQDGTGSYAFATDGAEVASPVLSDGAAVYTAGLSERRGGASKFVGADALGSTRVLTDGGQSATDTLTFDAFGLTVSRSGSTPTPFGFAGRAGYQGDADTGLLLLGHRYYDPSIGRFLSADPAQVGDNWYAYCDNDPVNETDPTGCITKKQQKELIALGEQAGYVTVQGGSHLKGTKPGTRPITYPGVHDPDKDINVYRNLKKQLGREILEKEQQEAGGDAPTEFQSTLANTSNTDYGVFWVAVGATIITGGLAGEAAEGANAGRIISVFAH